MAYRELQGLTIDQHRVLGKKLKNIQKAHSEIINEVWGAYGKSSKVGVYVRSAVKLDKLLQELDNRVWRETRLGPWQRESFGNLYLGQDFDEVRKEEGLPEWALIEIPGKVNGG